MSPRTLLPALVLSLVTPSTLAQGLELTWSGGVLGWGWEIELAGLPQTAYFLAPSLQTGPTPLALIDPADPRVIEVGLDLSSSWRFGQLDPSGLDEQVFLLPPVQAIVGVDLRAQAVEYPGASSVFGSISNPISTRLSLLGSAVTPQGGPIAVRSDHAQIALADGRVLLAGGRPGVGSALELEVFDPQTQSFHGVPGKLPFPLWHQEATLLDDGRVLLTGGVAELQGVSSSAFLFDPATGDLHSLPPLAAPRVLHTSTRLADGRVLLAGGASAFLDAHPLGFPLSLNTPLATCELFDPATESFAPAPALPAPLVGHAATLAPSGAVLVTGGVTPGPAGATTTKGILERSLLGAWNPVGDMLDPRAFHAQILSAAGAELLIASGATVEASSASVVGLPTTESWSILSLQPTSISIDLDLVIEGEEVCIPVPRLPKFPTGNLEHIIPTGDVPSGGVPILYRLGSGYSQLPFQPGFSQPNGQGQATIGFDAVWHPVGPALTPGLGHRSTTIDEGLRQLVVGPEGVRLVTLE